MTDKITNIIETLPNDIKYIVSDIDGVLTTDDKKEIAPGITEKLFALKELGVVIILNTLRGVVRYNEIVLGDIENIVDFGISERGAIRINNNKTITPLISDIDIKEIEKFKNQIEQMIVAKGAKKGPGPYICVQYYFADNEKCNEIIEAINQEPVYKNRTNDLILEATGQKSIILTKKGIDKAYGVTRFISKADFKKTVILGDDKIDETMFQIPGTHSYNVGYNDTLFSKYTTTKKGYEASKDILDAIIAVLNK